MTRRTLSLAVMFGALAGTAAMFSGCGSSNGMSDGANTLREQEAREYGYLSTEKVAHFKEQLAKLKKAMREEKTLEQQSIRSSLSSQALRYRAALESGLNDDDSISRRAISAAVLGFSGDSRYALKLAQIGADNLEDARVSTYAMAGLAELGLRINDSTSREQVMSLIRSQLLPSVSTALLRVNAVTAYARAYSAARGDLLAPLMDAATQDPDNDVRRQALLELGEIGDPASVASIASVALNDPAPEIRATAAVALGHIPDPVALEALEDAQHDPSGPVRMQAVYALAAQQAISQDKVLDMVVSKLADLDESVRRSAAITAGRLGDARATVPLLQTLSDRSDNVRLAAVQSLARVVTPERERDAFPVAGLLNDGDQQISHAAHDTLKKVTGRAISASTDEWVQYFYKKYPDLDPETQYADNPRPRMQATSIGRTGTTRGYTGGTTGRTTQQPRRQTGGTTRNNRGGSGLSR